MNARRLLRYARRRAGLTQRALATRAGVPQPAIARIESGTVTPRLDTLIELLAASDHTLELAPMTGAGVDRTLIRAALARTPEDRIRSAARAARSLGAYLDAVNEFSR